MIASTRPRTASIGTVPNVRLSIDSARSSPSTNSAPSGTCTGPEGVCLHVAQPRLVDRRTVYEQAAVLGGDDVAGQTDDALHDRLAELADADSRCSLVSSTTMSPRLASASR